MLINKSFLIPSCDDRELNLKRKNKLEYRISYDPGKTPKALVFMVGGWGATKNIKFYDFERENIAKTFDVICVQVYHHAIHRRISTESKYSAKKVFEKEDVERIKSYFESIGWDSKGISTQNAPFAAQKLIQRVAELKSQGVMDKDYQLELTLGLSPARDDYENAGIMSAIDYINALKHLDQIIGGGGGSILKLPKIYAGGSYGGYLALLISKIAPFYVDAILDNSGSALPQVRFILGRETKTCDMIDHYPHNQIQYYTKTLWTRDPASKYYFSDDCYLIRSILNPTHLEIQKRANPRTIFVSYHSLIDELNPSKDKQNLYEIYKHLGFDATLHLIKDESELDGRLLKSLDHGLRMSDKAMIKKELPIILEKIQNQTQEIPSYNEISYPCKEKIYRFKDTKEGFLCEIFNK
ncbi:DUF2920 family protein [Campylobacter upsaliensis]|uniref:DUF2920 family protein n=1 Tax=Campylobacter upsaliensis TaxID=28080 RepID=UPI0012C0ADD5|nr:DUF2920 family protein [Campylobacter upsaliensis]EAK9897004.1 DUF2920 family protein [Campylobacter upsaliensis]EDP6882668.1 DUF2920 family protein [Campylobacter upsaliensis]EDP6908536.1 DUF2920 family protein [Campylobacter upsaliensis]EGL3837671.1 DUF2920 family protein [Campylobacter upsaliensis]EGL3839327.1 DUF2920 family protein [Campylobacter upsaliensis]